MAGCFTTRFLNQGPSLTKASDLAELGAFAYLRFRSPQQSNNPPRYNAPAD